jgi:phospholipase/carboxylesterase
MSTATLSFVHRFEPAALPGRPPLLLLHGTGGNEDDLVPVGQAIARGSALLSPRGQVLEQGMPRFFRRLAEGVFDVPDLIRRTHDLADFVAAARTAHDLAAPIAVGFSNGANIAAAMLLLRPEALAGAVLFRAMIPFADEAISPRASVPVLLVSGAADPIVPAANAAGLAAMLARSGAEVTHHVLPVGHGLSQQDLALARDWLARFQG